ncbi:MAG: N-formylglutamate amidohydrolase [Rhizobiaceae bacterium]|nr:N-formylglutamate amidohydrolase [Rhizobiaceae bacterium]
MPAEKFVVDEVVGTANPGGSHPIFLVCEHASARIPPEFRNLGLTGDALTSHIAWDPGALDTALAMSDMLGAPLVYSTVSRLIYDCNRPPESSAAMPARSEVYQVPGNIDLAAADKRKRVETYYRPFERSIEAMLDARGANSVLVTVHSFTPVFNGTKRDVEIGILHDEDARLADALLHVADGYDIRRNEPYGPADGVTHTLRRHAQARNLLNVMIEIRNDLLVTPDQCQAMAAHLARWLEEALANVRQPQAREAAS